MSSGRRRLYRRRRAVALAAVLYGMSGQAARKPRAPVRPLLPPPSALHHWRRANSPRSQRREIPEARDGNRFDGPSGEKLKLSEFRGKTVLLIFGDLVRALPCRNAGAGSLQGELGGKDFEVVAVNIDTARLNDARHSWTRLASTNSPFTRPQGGHVPGSEAGRKVIGLPTTI